MAIGLVNVGVGYVVSGWDLTNVRSCVVQDDLNSLAHTLESNL